MVSKAVYLFLFGVSLTYGKFLPRLNPAQYEVAAMPGLLSNGCPSAPELAPLICKLMQPNIGYPYKPQLIRPSTYVPPLVVENCDTPQLQVEVELPPIIEEKPIVIPQPPSLPPITIPKFPIPVMIEKPIPPPVPIVEPCEPAFVPEMPVVIPVAPPLPPIVEPEPCLDDVVEPVVIPQPPELPAFVMPELPVPVAEPPMFVAPCPEDEPVPVVSFPEYIQPLAPVPAPPQLPPVRLPELPVHIEIPPQPIISPPMIVEDPCITEEIVVPQPAPVFVPQPPRLPEPVHVAFEEPIPMPIFSDPCEPAVQPVVKMGMGGLPPYFVKHAPSQHFGPREHVQILSLPYMPNYKK